MNTLKACSCPDPLCADGKVLWGAWRAALATAESSTAHDSEAQRLHWKAAAAYAVYAFHVRNARRARAYNARVALDAALASGDKEAIARAEAAYQDARAAAEETFVPG